MNGKTNTMKTAFFALAVGVALASFAADGGNALFADGKTSWSIVVPDGASRHMRYAAGELATTLKKISGAEFPVVEASAAPQTDVISLVSDDTGAIDDVFSVKAAPGRIVLRGNTPRGTLFAVYAFLRERLDARWYWPGETGEFLPKLSRFDVEPWEKEYRPAFGLREMSICTIWMHRHAPTERWFPKVFLNCDMNSPEVLADIDFVRIASDHYVAIRDKKIREAHPEWLALVNGSRSGGAGCWSNEGFRHYIVSNIVAQLRAGKYPIANIYPADTTIRCECPECTANPDKSARWWSFYAKLREDIVKELPDIRFAGLGYQEYRDVPGIDITGLEYVEYGQYNRCYYHNLGDPDCPSNVHSMKEFRRWAEKAPPALYGYEFDVFRSHVSRPLWRVIGDEMRVFRDMGLRRVKTELNVDLNRIAASGVGPALPKHRIFQITSRLSLYAWAMAAFDPDIDMDALVDDFCRHVYGPAAEPMKAYHNLFADAWGAMKKHITYYEHNPRGIAADFITKEMEAKARELLAAAAKAAEGDGRAAGEVAVEAGCLEDWAALAEESRKARLGGVILELSTKVGANTLDQCPWLPSKARRGIPQPTRFKICRETKALRVFADCEEDDPGFERGTDKHDAHTNWRDESIEIFIDTGNGFCRQIAVTPAGGVWDASDDDLLWDSGAKATPAFSDDRWTLDISIPYESLGGEPRLGDRWDFMVIRNGGKHASCGWPIDAHRDFSSAATLIFK